MRQMSKAKSSQSFATRAIHHGYDPLENEGSLSCVVSRPTEL